MSRSTLRLSEVARHVVVPEGIVSTGWPAVSARIVEWGDSFDAWQVGIGQAVLGKREDGLYACTIGGVVLSIPRQVAKTFIVGRILFALATLFPGMKIIWTAHRVSTAGNTFANLRRFAKSKRVAPYVAYIRSTNGEQEIGFTNGSVIRFGARESGFGRGWDEIDVEVFDEAQILTNKAIEDLVAATNQTRHQHGALIFYMGTPPRPGVDPGEVFSEHRAEALTLKRMAGAEDFGSPVIAGDTVFVECSADSNVGKPGGPALMDRNQIMRANPAYPTRVPESSMLRLRKHLKDDASWRREALGVWDEIETFTAFPFARWSKLVTIAPPADGTRVLGVKFSLDGARVAVSAAIRPDPANDMAHVECIGIAPMSEGTAWLVDKIAGSWRSYAAVVVDGKSGAGDFVNALRAKKVPSHRIVTPTTDQVITAHSGFLRSILDATTTHMGQPGLDAQIKTAGRRKIGAAGGWGVEPTTAGGDVVGLESAIFARWGAVTTKRRTGTRTETTGRSGSGRRGAVVL